MKQGQFNELFYLQHISGDTLYPITIKNRETGQISYVLSKKGNKRKDALDIFDEAEVKDLVINHNYAVRAATKSKSRSGLYKIAEKSITKVVEC
ncbi:MAG: transposase [Oceanospirillales bacterium]|nr:transposase [Oceanospirillales bacterium]